MRRLMAGICAVLVLTAAGCEHKGDAGFCPPGYGAQEGHIGDFGFGNRDPICQRVNADGALISLPVRFAESEAEAAELRADGWLTVNELTGVQP